ncbi:MAG TPA: ribokinase, partial [Beijerinckiaceae bacterium]|nr:ribokinase [Beijerinckiaceae bacterium]
MSDAARIAVLGSVNVDLVVRAGRLPRPGETLHGESFTLALGGKGANQACAAARLGADVCFIARTGTDGFGDFACDRLAAFGLGLDHLARESAVGAGIAVIAVDSRGENAITIVSGANARLSPADAEAARAELSGSAVLLVQCETPFDASLAAARIVASAGGRVILDPAPAPQAGIPVDLMALADLVTPNETEAALLTGIPVRDRDSALAAARALRESGARAAVVKLGGAGLVYADADSEGFLPPFAVRVVDTVAAGDCFNAGLAVALAGGANLLAALSFAT